MKKRFVLAATLLLGISCSSVSREEVADIKEADQAMVAQCEFLGSVESVAKWELNSEHAFERVKNGVKANAKKIGATHVVLNPPTTRPLVQTGKAYRCPAASS